MMTRTWQRHFAPGGRTGVQVASAPDSIKEDLATLEALEHEYDAHLRFGDAVCSITRDGVRFGRTFIPIDGIRRFRMGLVVTGIGTATEITFTMVVGGILGNEIKIDRTTRTDLDAQQQRFWKLVDAARAYVLPKIAVDIRQMLDRDQHVQIGNVVLKKAGVEFAIRGWFRSRPSICPWSRLTAKIENGELVLADPWNENARANLVLREVDNAAVLHFWYRAHEREEHHATNVGRRIHTSGFCQFLIISMILAAKSAGDPGNIRRNVDR